VDLFSTPLLIPSFSSKGFPEMKKIIKVMGEFITEAVLVSAYDVHHMLLNTKQITFPSVIFLDSGGYEARVEHDLSEAYGQDYKPRKWTARDHFDVLRTWKSAVPTVAISYDSPRRHSRIEQQLAAALELKRSTPQFMHEFLIKPERKGQFVEPASIARIASSISQFHIIGVTEHELDHRIIGRMEKLAKIRRILDEHNVASPIHVFGSLDSLSTVLYFLSGAEIFDGLTWLRFGFHEGHTVYKQNYGAIRGENGILKNSRELSHAMWKDNYYYLESLRSQMRNFARTKNSSSFAYIAPQIEMALQQLEPRI